MRKSFSKIRHIQEVNRVLENRLLSEQTNQSSQEPQGAIFEPNLRKPLTIKVFKTLDEKKSNTRSLNIKIFEVKLISLGVRMMWGYMEDNQPIEDALFRCDSPDEPIRFGSHFTGFVSDKVQDWLQSKCNAAASTGTPTSSMV